MSTLPSVPEVPKDLSAEMRRFLFSIKEIIEIREGLRGSGDQYISQNDLASGAVPLPSSDTSAIGPPTNMTIEVGTWTNTIKWTNPIGDHLAGVEIWVNQSNSVTEAIRVAIVSAPGDSYVHNVQFVTMDNYYWIRAVTHAGKYSVWVPSALQGGMLVPRKESLGERIEGVIEALLGADPPMYDGGTVYTPDELVRWLAADGNIKRYKRTLYDPGVSGHDPSETLYWARVGILIEGDVGGQQTVGIDGNLVVDNSILARSIETGSLVVGDGTDGSIRLADGVITVAHINDLAHDDLLNSYWAHGNDITKIDGGRIFTGSILANSIGAGQITANHVGTNTIIANTANIQSGIIQSAHIGAAQILAANIANGNITNAKIGAAAVGTANIQDASITTAKIGALSIDTLHLAGNAVTVPVAVYNAGDSYTPVVYGSPIIQLGMSSLGAPVNVWFGAYAYGSDVNNTASIKIRRDSIDILSIIITLPVIGYDTGSGMYYFGGYIFFMAYDAYPPASATYYAINNGVNTPFSARSMFAIGLKR